MRVALIDPSLFSLPYDAALAAGLAAQGHSVTLYGRRMRADDGAVDGAPLVPSFYRVAGLSAVEAMPKPFRLGIKGLDHIFSMVALNSRLSRERPDIIHFQWLPLPLVDRRFLSALHRIAPLVLTVHDSNPFNGDPAARVQLNGFAASFSHFDRMILHTEQGRGRLIAQGVTEDRIALLPHGLLGDGQTANSGQDAMAGELSFLLFGKLKPYKGLDLLIEAFARLPDTLRAQARVRAVGKPYMDLAPVRALAQRLGVAERVSIEPRFVPDKEISNLFAPGTIAAFPYREIEASGVLSLAITHARPILAARLGGFAETVRDGTDGLLVPPGDVDALAEAMARFIVDRQFAAACTRNVRELAGEIPDWSEIAYRTVAVYQAAGATSS